MKRILVAECEEGVVFLETGDTLLKVLEFGDINEGDVEDEKVKQLEQLQDTLDYYGCGPAVETPMKSGAYYRRIWRGNNTPKPESLDHGITAAWVSTVRATRMLYSRLGPLFAAIEPDARQDGSYGFLQREILILACTEVESAWRTVLEHNNATGKGNYWTTKDYVRLLGPMRLDEWAVSLSSHHLYRTIRPFKGWDDEHPTTSLPWYDAYNAVKHGRESALEQATFGHVVDAVAAAFVMTVAQFGPSHLEAGSAYFHPDEFTIQAQPKWTPTQRYLAPTNMGIERGEWLGHDKWTWTFCPELGRDG